MLGVPPKSNGAATNDCVMWRLTNTRRPGFFGPVFVSPANRGAGSAVTRGAQHVTAIRWLGVNDHSVPPGLGRPGRVLHPPRRSPTRVAPKQPRNAHYLRQGPFARRARESVSTSLWGLSLAALARAPRAAHAEP